ncbi:MAG TPA: hypothetical protein DCL38_10240 [Lachnospiraceae bacterium]|nr:hypothetical protein [Lachnospiraceae bacterium]
MQALNADYTGLNESMIRMGELILKMVKAVDALEENVDRLDISWSGEANVQFMLAFYDDFNRMRTLIENMLRFKRNLRTVIFEYQKSEALVSEKVKEVKL